jgi:hypothetical protein
MFCRKFKDKGETKNEQKSKKNYIYYNRRHIFDKKHSET